MDEVTTLGVVKVGVTQCPSPLRNKPHRTPQGTEYGFPGATSSSGFGGDAGVPVLAVLWECHRCVSWTGPDCYQGARWTRGPRRPHPGWLEALGSVRPFCGELMAGSWQAAPTHPSPPQAAGAGAGFAGRPPPPCDSPGLRKGPGRLGEILRLGFNWFPSIKLSTDDRLTSSVKCIKFLTTFSIRWKKHNKVWWRIAWDSRTSGLKAAAYEQESDRACRGPSGRPVWEKPQPGTAQPPSSRPDDGGGL